MRPLAYTGPKRSPDLPDVPTMTESRLPQVGFNPDVWMGVFVPTGRIVINTPTLFGGMGYSCATDPSFMLGTGTWSGSIVSDNVTPLHLINIKRIAHEVRPWRSIYQPNMGL